jgi:hypothetical protein
MEKNKTGKYFKYAIGEIVLVVIGILIALQINNWNEKYKDRIIEKQILDEMLISLKSDNATFVMLTDRLREKDSAIQKIIDFREQNELPNSKLYRGVIGAARQRIRFSYDKSPYENIVALGINKMSNKELLKGINKYYTQQLPRSIKFIDGIQEEYLKKIENYDQEAVERGLLKRQFVKRDGENKWSVWKQSSLDEILNDEHFVQSMIDEFQYMSNALGRLENLISYNKALIELLEKNK